MSGQARPIDLRVRGFRLELAGRPLLEDLHVRVRAGEAVGLVGPNGCGKSLLLASWLGAAPEAVSSSGYVQAGSCLLHDSLGACRDALDELVGRQLGVVLAEPGVHLNPAIPALEQLRLACSQAPEGLRLEQRLEIVGLRKDALDRYPAYLSSGQRQRLAVACALLGRGILLCDDPSSSLDPVLRGHVFSALARQKQRGELALLVLAARPDDLPRFVDRLVELPERDRASEGARERGSDRDGNEAGGGWQPRDDAAWRRSDASLSLAPSLPRSHAPSGLPAVRIRNLAVRRERELVLGAVDLDVQAGEIVAIVGESGAGKSTVLEALVRNVAVEPGTELRVLGHDLARLKPEVGRPDPPALAALRRRLRIAFQDPETVFDPALSTGAVLQRFRARSDRHSELGRVLLAHLEARRDVPIRQLSGWDKRALCLWAALDRDVEVLLADEPLAGADAGHLRLILDGFVELAARGVAVLIVTHLLPPVAAVADRVAVLHGGRLVEMLPGTDLLHAARHSYTRSLVAAALDGPAAAQPHAGRQPPDSPRLPFVPLLACQASVEADGEPFLCAADEHGRIHAFEAGRWRPAAGQEAEHLAAILALRGLDAAALLA